MNMSSLLEKLIIVSKRNKTDFALSMNMTPSGLSKILTGGRLPNVKDRHSFTEKAAGYFAEAIYGHGCYLKLAEVFPFSYEFRTRDELRYFFLAAIEYALDQDLTVENSVNLSYSDRGFYYLGRRSVLNNLCVLLSDCAIQAGGEKLEVFLSAPLFSNPYFTMLEEIRIADPGRVGPVAVNYIVDPDTIALAGRELEGGVLSHLVEAQRYFDLDLWRSDTPLGQSFLLVKGRLLLIMNEQLDGTPLLLPVVHKNYLSLFYYSLLNRKLKKISYSRAAAAEFLERCPSWGNKLLRQGVDMVYNFTSVGYLLKREELERLGGNSAVTDLVSKLFASILTGKTSFVVSMGAQEQFGARGLALAPGLGAVRFSEKERMDYMARFDNYLKNESAFRKVKLIQSKLTNLAILFSGKLCLVYTTDDEGGRDRIHVFRREVVHSLLEREIMSSQIRLMDLSDEIWSTYRRE